MRDVRKGFADDRVEFGGKCLCIGDDAKFFSGKGLDGEYWPRVSAIWCCKRS